MNVDPTQIVLQIANFLILLYVLNRFMYKPILKVLEARSKKIQEGLEAAEKSLEDQAQADDKRQQMLVKAEQESTKILDEARNQAKQTSKEIVSVARNEAKQAVEKEYKLLQAKLQEEEQKARRNIASLVTDATAAVLSGSLDAKQHKLIIKNQIKNLDKVKN